MVAVFEQILTTVQSDVQALALEGVQSADVSIRKSVDFGLNVPCVQITFPRPEIMRHDDGTNNQDDVIYPVLATFVDHDNHNQVLHFDSYLNWRKRVADHFRHQPLSAVTGVSTCHVEPIDIIGENEWLSDQGLWVSALLLLFSCREDRG